MLTDADLQRVFKRVPLLTMFGDFFGTDVGDWSGRMAECVGYGESDQGSARDSRKHSLARFRHTRQQSHADDGYEQPADRRHHPGLAWSRRARLVTTIRRHGVLSG
jgi:hypothetical protein